MSIKSFLSHMLLFSSGKKPKPSLGEASAGKTHSQPKSEEDLLSSVVFLEGSEMKPIEECANSQGCWTAADEVSISKRVNLVPNQTDGIVLTTPSKLERRELQAMSDRPSIAKFLHSIKKNTQKDNYPTKNNQQTQAGSCFYFEKNENIVKNTEEYKNENEQSEEQQQDMIKEAEQIKLVCPAEEDCGVLLNNIENKCFDQSCNYDSNGQIEEEKKEEEEQQEDTKNRHDGEQQNQEDMPQDVVQKTKAIDEEGNLDGSNMPAEPQPQTVNISLSTIQPNADEIAHIIPQENADLSIEKVTTYIMPETHCVIAPADQCCNSESASKTPETHQKVTFEPALEEISEQQDKGEDHNSKLAGRKATPFSSLKHVPLPYLSRQNQHKNHNQQQQSQISSQILLNKNSSNSTNQISKMHNNTNTSSNPANIRTTACRSLSDSNNNNIAKNGIIKTKLPLALTMKAFQEQKNNLNNNLKKNLFQVNSQFHQQTIQSSISQDSRQNCDQVNAIEIVEEKDSQGSHSDKQYAGQTAAAPAAEVVGVDIKQLSGSSNDDSNNKMRHNNKKKLIGDNDIESQQQRRIKTTQGDAQPIPTVIRGTFLQNQLGGKVAYKTCIFCKNDIRSNEDTKTFTCCHKAHLGCVPKDKNVQCLRCNSNNMANKYRPKV